MSEARHEGGCGCGALRFVATGVPIFVNNCHCTQCQHQTGSTSVVNAFFESDRVELLAGALSEHQVRAGSGKDHIICRCASCGVAVWSHYPRFGRLGTGVRVGTFDDPAAFRPDAVIFTSEAMSWVALPEDIPRFERYYDPFALLPPERVARFRALLARVG